MPDFKKLAVWEKSHKLTLHLSGDRDLSKGGVVRAY
jgi:hypothetical protein